MANIVKRIGNLLTIKSLVTLMLSVVFAILSLRGIITPDLFMQVFVMIIAFYFGTTKKDDTGSAE